MLICQYDVDLVVFYLLIEVGLCIIFQLFSYILLLKYMRNLVIAFS